MGAFVLFNLQNQPAGGAASPAGVTGSQSISAAINRGPYRSVVADRIPEGTSPTIELVITDDSGEDLTLDDIDFAKLTLKLHGTDEIINTRDAQDIKNANNVKMELYGEAPKGVKFTFPMTPADTPMIGTGARETHEAFFYWKLAVSGLEEKHQVLHTVRKL
jgi:hypothetical protein